MAHLSDDPKEWELEDLVAAHLVSRGYFVETGIKERHPDELLELDLVWTNYDVEPQVAHPVEVKSGDWGLGDFFKFFGWSNYLRLPPGQFAFKRPPGRIDPKSLEHVAERTGVAFLHIAKADDMESQVKSLGLRTPASPGLPELWRFSFWCQRRLLRSLSEGIKKGVYSGTLKAAKEYYQLINDSVFFVPDVRDRVALLLQAHFDHPDLAASAAHELETAKTVLIDPPQSKAFSAAYYAGKHFPIQACLYLGHRARLYILKAIVDYALARERGEIERITIKLGDALLDVTSGKLTAAMARGVDDLSSATSFKRFPLFWQVFLWSWGGFLLKDRLDLEYAALSAETGVPVDEIPLALSVFDRLFPTKGGWFREPSGDSRRVLMLMPPTIRGIGAFRRQLAADVDDYGKLGVSEDTRMRMSQDHNTCARHLECPDTDLVT